MATSFYTFVLASLGVWRVTHLLHAEAGPGEIFTKLRAAAGAGVVGRALACFYCASIWVAAPFALWLGATLGERLLLWLALSAAAILLEQRRPAQAASQVAPALFVEDAAPAAEE